MFAVNASAARVASSARARASPARGRHISSFGSVRTASAPSRGAALRLRAAKNNPNFDPNDPMTWGTPAEGSDEAFFEEFAAPVEDLMQLSDEQLGQLLGAEGATVPVMLDDASAAAGSEDDVANPSVAIDLPPENAAQAIDKGLALYKNGDYPEALAAFTSALDLPGSGPVRSRKARVMPAGPSQGFADASVSLNEQIAIHYNCACCHARMDDAQSGLVSLVRAMEAGYDDYENVRTDPDIAPLRADGRFEGIMAKFEPKGVIEGVFSMLSKGTTREQAKRGGAPKGGGGAELLGSLFDKLRK